MRRILLLMTTVAPLAMAAIHEWPSFEPKTEMLLNIGDALRAQAPPDKLALDLMDELPAPPRR